MNDRHPTRSRVTATTVAFIVLSLAIMSPRAQTAVASSQNASGQNTSDGLEEVVVTATRRAERLQDVPLAVSVATGEQLAETGFKDLTNIQYALPGVYHGDSPNDSGYRLRGVGTAGGYTSASEQNVGLVVDGVVIPFGNPVASLGDVDRIEALKGPQGTQFGKNASSGVISVTTQRPDLNKVYGDVFGSYGTLNERDLHGTINVPLSSTVAVQVSAFDRSYDGFIQNVVQKRDWGGSESDGVRGKLLWQPNSDFSAYLIADYSDTRTQGPGQLWTLNRLSPSYDPFFNFPFVNLAALGVTPGPNNDKSIDEYSTDGKAANYGASLELNYNLNGYTLTSVTAYRGQLLYPINFGIDASPLPRFTGQAEYERDSFVSEELRVASPKGGHVEYIAGLYVSNLISGGKPQSAQLRPNPADPNFIISITNGFGQSETGSSSQAAFFDGSLKLTDQWRIVAGGRVSHDNVNAATSSVVDPSLPPFNPPPPFGTGPDGTVPYAPTPYQTAQTSHTGFSGRIGPEFRLTDDLMFYATYARGYLGPTVTFSGLTATKSNVKPQSVDDVTVGAKMQFLERRLTVNGDLFYDKYTDLQTSVFNGLEFLTENAGGLTAKGFEVETSYRIGRHIGVNAGYTYSHAYFTDYLTSCPASIAVQGAAAVAARCGAAGGQYQAGGQPLPGAPLSTVTLGADYARPITSALTVDAAANFYSRSEVYGAAGDTTTIQPGYQIVNLNLGIGSPDGLWRLGVFARNLLDKRFQSAVIGLPFSNPGATVNWETRDGRRTVGVSLESHF